MNGGRAVFPVALQDLCHPQRRVRQTLELNFKHGAIQPRCPHAMSTMLGPPIFAHAFVSDIRNESAVDDPRSFLDTYFSYLKVSIPLSRRLKGPNRQAILHMLRQWFHLTFDPP